MAAVVPLIWAGGMDFRYYLPGDEFLQINTLAAKIILMVISSSLSMKSYGISKSHWRRVTPK